MRCSICGTKLKKEGEVCSNCYNELQAEEEYRNDVNEVFKIKRAYRINYEIVKNTELVIIFGICLTLFILARSFFEFLMTILIAVIVFGIILFIDKRIANATTVTFYEKKAVYRFKLGIFNKEKEVKYKDIKDIKCFQTFRQKKMDIGDLCFYAKGAIPGALLLNGFQIKDIEDVTETLEKIKGIIGL